MLLLGVNFTENQQVVDAYTLEELNGKQEEVYKVFLELAKEKKLSDYEIEGWAYIITRESNWDVYACNPSSGAYGLPQSLPASKMATHGSDWAENPRTQLLWMYDYMVNRYGSIAGAVDFWNANQWY